MPLGAIITILSPLANNIGFFTGAPGSTVQIQTQALPAGSPVINAGNNANAAGLSTEQRRIGFARIVGANVDIGAFEVQ